MKRNETKMERYINTILNCKDIQTIDNVIFNIAMDDKINNSECKALQILAYTKRKELLNVNIQRRIKRNETIRIKRLAEAINY